MVSCLYQAGMESLAPELFMVIWLDHWILGLDFFMDPQKLQQTTFIAERGLVSATPSSSWVDRGLFQQPPQPQTVGQGH